MHNFHKIYLLRISPKLAARYIYDFYKAAQNIKIHTT
jgi:hypothetical protein